MNEDRSFFVVVGFIFLLILLILFGMWRILKPRDTGVCPVKPSPSHISSVSSESLTVAIGGVGYPTGQSSAGLLLAK